LPERRSGAQRDPAAQSVGVNRPSLKSFFPIIRVQDLERALGFYEGLLGLERGYQWPPKGDGELRFVVVRLDNWALGIGQADRTYEPDDRYELCFYVGDVDETVRELRAAGVPVEHEPEDMPWGERMAWVADPDGNRIHLTERSSETVTSS
jgi:lactoylglutathione lyase